MIPGSGIYDIYCRPVAAGQDADDVARRLALDLVVEGDRGLHAERNGLEALLLGGGGEGGEVLARRGHELLGRLVGQPAVDQRLVHIVVFRIGVELRPGTTAGTHVPPITTGTGLMST